jgi:riboflavin synthase
MLIEYTQKHVIIPHKEPGARVNIEVDVMGKYAERASAAAVASLGAQMARLEGALSGVAAKLEARLGALEARVAGLEGAQRG